MSTPVATLVIEMAANVARLQSDMNSAKGMVGGAMNEITRVTDVAKKALAALGVTASIGAFVGMIKGAVDAAGALHDLSQKTGASVEALSAFQAVGKLSGTTAEQIGGAMNKMAKNMAVANEDSKGTAQAIKALGINFDDFRRMKPDEQMQTVAKAMNQFADGSGKTAVAMTLFGKAGAELLPFMNDLATTGTLNAKITSEQAAMADHFGDNLVKLKASGESWKRELAMGMLPALDSAGQAFLDVFNQSGGLRDSIRKLAADGSISAWTRQAIVGLTYIMDMMSGVKRIFQTVGEVIGGSLAIIGTSVAALGAAAKKLLSGDFAGALADVRTGMSQAKTIAKDLGATVSDIWSEETTGQKIRARIAEVEKMGAVSQAAKPQIDMREQIDGNTKATKAHADAQKLLLERVKITSEYQLEGIEITAKRIELDKNRYAELIRAEEAAAEWAKNVDSIMGGLTDALFRAFEDGKGYLSAFVDTLKAAFGTLILRPTIQAIMRPVAGAMGGVMSGVGSAVAGTGGGGSGMLSTLGSLGGLTGLGGMFGSGLGFGLIGGFGGGMGIAGTLGAGASMFTGGLAGGMAGLGSTIAGVGAMLGAVMPVIAGVYAIWKGFSRGPKKVTETGISGTLVGGEATAQLYEKWKQSGGWIVGDRKGKRYKDLSDEMSAGLDQATAGIYGQVKEWTKALGLPAEQLADVTHAISIKIGKDDAETQANIEAAMQGYQDALAARFEGFLEPFRNAGETLTDTLQRLVGIQAMSEQLNEFGGVFSRIANLSVDAREELIGFAGGIEALLEKTKSFVSAYYSEGEQAAIAAKQIRDALGAMGIGADISSKGDFRALVEGLDVSSTEGRKQLDALLSIAQTFAPVADYLGKAGGTLASLADQAPQSQILQSMFDATAVTNEAAQRTADGVDRVNTSITEGANATVAALGDVSARVDSLAAVVQQALAANARSITGAIEELA
jgi:hypothetical protein